MAKISRAEFGRLLPQLWCAETSASPALWTPQNAALSECVPTTALAQRIFGGAVLWTAPLFPDGRKDSHYHNDFHDFTRQQYNDPAIVFPPSTAKEQGLGSTYNYMCSFPAVAERVALMADRFNQLSRKALPTHSWLLLDMDDTLIKTQLQYDRARARLAEDIAPDNAGKQKEIVAFAAAASAELYGKARNDSARDGFAYARGRFPASLVTTMAYFKPNAAASDIGRAWDIGQGAFAAADLNDGAIELVAAAKAKGLKLGIITQGDNGVQRERLAQLPFMNRIDAVLVTPVKTAATFTTFMKAHGVDPARSVMLGDSLKSDMIPAAEAGLSTVLLEGSANWSAVEMERQAQPAGMRRTPSLGAFAQTL